MKIEQECGMVAQFWGLVLVWDNPVEVHSSCIIISQEQGQHQHHMYGTHGTSGRGGYCIMSRSNPIGRPKKYRDD